MTIQLLHAYNGMSPGVYTLAGAEETRLIGLGLARSYTDGIDGKNTQFSEPEKAATQALVSKEGNYCLGANVDYLVANNTLTDADGVLTQKQMAVITVPGGLFGPKSVLEVNLVGLTSGANGKNFGFKAGPASGTMSSATAFGGGGGLTTHAALGFRSLLWGNGVAGAQRATPVGMQNWTGTNANAFITLAIDTSLDWNIYVFCQFTSTAAGDSAMLRTFWANWQN